MSYILRRKKLGLTSCKEIAARSTVGIGVIRNDAPLRGDVPYVFRWGCTSTIPAGDRKIVNDAAAIHWCSNKRKGRLDMQAGGVAVPRTFGDAASFAAVAHKPEDKFVVRPETHAQGRNLIVGNAAEALVALAKFGGGYISDLVNKVAEYRVYVIQGRVACVARKTPGNPDDVAWNVAQGGRFDNVKWGEWPVEACLQAIRCAEIGKLDFCGVDVMLTEDKKPWVLEVNSAPSLTSPYRQQCFAKAFDYIVKNGKDTIPLPAKASKWKDLIHPAVVAEAA